MKAMLDYKALNIRVKEILDSYSPQDRKVWLDLKKEKENLERLACGETVSVWIESFSQAVIPADLLKQLIDVKLAGENNYVLAA